MNAREAEQLRAARALIAKPRGWIKGESSNGRGGYCAYGACAAIVTGQAATWRLFDFLRAEAPGRAVAAFNDDPKTRKKDVLAVFDRAIAAAEAE